VKFFGHMVSETGITPLPKHVAAIHAFPPPSTVKQLQQFLGMINFYRMFLPKIAATLRPLTDLLRGNPKSLDWSAAAADAFAAAKAALVLAVPLSHPTPGTALSLAVDASDSHVGSVLQQLENRAWRPLAFFSQKLSPAQVRYSTFDRELLAAYSAVRHFRFLLEGRKFQILTDHKPLVAAMTHVTPPWSGRQQRHLSFLAEFTSDLRHTSGHSNVVADTLSRPPPEKSKESAAAVYKPEPVVAFPFPAALHASKTTKKPEPADLCTASSDARPPQPPAAGPAAIDFQALAAAQQSCPEVAAMSSSPSLQIVRRPAGDAHLLGDISTGTFRPLVPPIFRQAVMRSLHEVHHPGVRATTRLIKASFCWPKMGKT
jgi:cleavage and polyadenylation specificity factor subunit 1